MAKQTQQPWERREDETSKSYMAFCFYRDLGPARSLPKAWERYRDECGLKAVDPTGTFKDWCSGNDWVDRSQAFDDHEDEMRRAAREQARQEARDTFTRYAVMLAAKLVDVASGTEEAGRDQVRAILEALDRAGITVPKEMKVEHSGPDGGPIEHATLTADERRDRIVELLSITDSVQDGPEGS